MFYRRGTTGATARRFYETLCEVADTGRRRATGPPAGLEKWHGTANRFCVFIRIRATSVLASRQALLFVMVEAFVYIPAYSWCAEIIVVSAFSDRHAVILVRKHIPLFQSCTVVICGRWALLFIQAVKPALMKPCQTREPRGPLPSGGNSAANLLSLKRPAHKARSPGCRTLSLPSGRLFRPALMKPCQTREPRGPLPSGGNSAANLLSL